jgi:hypothetical protein
MRTRGAIARAMEGRKCPTARSVSRLTRACVTLRSFGHPSAPKQLPSPGARISTRSHVQLSGLIVLPLEPQHCPPSGCALPSLTEKHSMQHATGNIQH